MRLFWKALLLAAIPIGGYWLYKKGRSHSFADTRVKNENAAAKQGGIDSEEPVSPSRNKEKEVPTSKIIEQLSEIDGVTSRVAGNLVERGIKSKKALLKLSEEELRSVQGIGPKRAAKILNLR